MVEGAWDVVATKRAKCHAGRRLPPHYIEDLPAPR